MLINKFVPFFTFLSVSVRHWLQHHTCLNLSINKSVPFFADQGKFVAPTDVPFDQRALPDSSLKSPYRQYEVLKPIPEVNSGSAAPWFGKPGMGTQYQLPMSIDELVAQGFIKPIK
jgi:hypothetical protein